MEAQTHIKTLNLFNKIIARRQVMIKTAENDSWFPENNLCDILT